MRHNTEVRLSLLGGSHPHTVCFNGGLVRNLTASEVAIGARLHFALAAAGLGGVPSSCAQSAAPAPAPEPEPELEGDWSRDLRYGPPPLCSVSPREQCSARSQLNLKWAWGMPSSLLG